MELEADGVDTSFIAVSLLIRCRVGYGGIRHWIWINAHNHPFNENFTLICVKPWIYLLFLHPFLRIGIGISSQFNLSRADCPSLWETHVFQVAEEGVTPFSYVIVDQKTWGGRFPTSDILKEKAYRYCCVTLLRTTLESRQFGPALCHFVEGLRAGNLG